MKYDFDQQIAKQVGVEEAIMYSNISWWCTKNKADKSERHYHDGEYWTYSTEQAWSELFPFWSPKQVSRIINNLENAGLLESKQFGGNDRTKWYRPLVEKTEEIPKDQTVASKRPNGRFQKTKRSTPIYDTDNKPQIITSDISTEVQKPLKNSFQEAEVLFQELEKRIESKEIIDPEAIKFFNYWTAPVKSGKELWKTQKTFAFSMRWAYWKERSGGTMNLGNSKPVRGTVG